MSDDVAPVSGREARGDLVCFLCARTVGSAQGPDIRHLASISLKVPDPRHVESVRRLRCPYCSGRLLLQAGDDVYVERRSLSDESLRPRRGRPPKIRTAS